MATSFHLLDEQVAEVQPGQQPRPVLRAASRSCPVTNPDGVRAIAVVDLTGPTAWLLDVVPGRSAKALSEWVSGTLFHHGHISYRAAS